MDESDATRPVSAQQRIAALRTLLRQTGVALSLESITDPMLSQHAPPTPKPAAPPTATPLGTTHAAIDPMQASSTQSIPATSDRRLSAAVLQPVATFGMCECG
jgi:hypothetical protein